MGLGEEVLLPRTWVWPWGLKAGGLEGWVARVQRAAVLPVVRGSGGQGRLGLRECMVLGAGEDRRMTAGTGGPQQHLKYQA